MNNVINSSTLPRSEKNLHYMKSIPHSVCTMYKLLAMNDSHGIVISTCSFNFELSWFESWPADRLSWFVAFLSPSRQM